MVNPYIFRAYDIRGVFDKDLTAEVMKKIGFVLGKKKESFIVGKDIRESGPKLADSLITGLLTAGAKVTYTGTTSFGETLFAGWKLKKNKTLFVTASHLPPAWNGLKLFYGDGEPFSEKEISELKDEVIQINLNEAKELETKVEEVSIKNQYFDFLLNGFPELKNNNLKIVLDCGNGSMSLTAPELLEKFGFRLFKLYCQADSNFPNRDSEPTFESTEVLREKVIKEKADFGIAFDGDGDRGIVIDDKGRYLRGDQIGIIFAKNILKKSENKRIIATVTCSMGMEKELSPLGAEIIRVPVGHTFVISNCKKHNAVLGLEETSHISIPEYFLFDDAILTPLKTAAIILEENRRLSEMIEEIKIYPFEEIKFECPDQVKFQVAESLKRKLSQEYKRINIIDGVRVGFDYGWILIRPSNTSPIIRLYVEAEDQIRLEELKQKFSQILENEIKEY